VAPKAKLFVLKVLDKDGVGRLDWMIQAIHYAINWRGPNVECIRVISMSIGGPHDTAEHEAIQKAVASDILIICASGIKGTTTHPPMSTATQ